MKEPLDKADGSVLVEAALAYWYTDFDLGPEIQRFLATTSEDIQIRRAAYLVEQFSQFTCATDWRVANAKVALEHLRGSLLEEVTFAPCSRRYDKLAASWGLDKGFGLKVQALLPYQTRHYEATQRTLRNT